MSLAQTKFFGSVDFDDDGVLLFPKGMPGFEQHDRFLALSRPGTEPVVFLQSLVKSDLCFVTLPALSIQEDYQLAAAGEDLECLGFSPDRQPAIGTEALCLIILTLAQDQPPTANLMSPVLINLERKQGMQIIQIDTEYSHRHPLDTLVARAACL